MKVLGVLIGQDKRYKEYLVNGKNSMRKFLSNRHSMVKMLAKHADLKTRGPGRWTHFKQDQLLYLPLGDHHGRDHETNPGNDVVRKNREEEIPREHTS